MVALVIYLIGSIGITINYHYCGGHLVDIAFYHVSEENCCGEYEEQDHNCCSNEFFMLDTDDSETIVTYKCLNKCNGPVDFARYPCLQAITRYRFTNHEDLIPYDHGPPEATRPPSFIMNRVLII